MTVTVGIIGLGNISKLHISGYQKVDAQILCVSDADEALAKEAAAHLNCDYTTDYKQLLERDDIQAVSICVPNFVHFQVAMDAIGAGKCILCEKPMTTKVEDAEALAAKVQETDAFFQIAYMKRFHPAFQKFKEYVSQIGDLQTGIVRVFHPFRESGWEKKSWFTTKAQSGGGPLVHSGSHMLDIMRWVVGDPARVDARIKMRPGFDVDYLTNALLDMENGGTLFLEVGWLPLTAVGRREDGWDELIELRGNRGKLTIFSALWDAPTHEIPAVELYTEQDHLTQRWSPGKFNYFDLEIASFVEAVAEQRKPIPNVVDGYRVDAIIDALYRSANAVAPVEINFRF